LGVLLIVCSLEGNFATNPIETEKNMNIIDIIDHTREDNTINPMSNNDNDRDFLEETDKIAYDDRLKNLDEMFNSIVEERKRLSEELTNNNEFKTFVISPSQDSKDSSINSDSQVNKKEDFISKKYKSASKFNSNGLTDKSDSPTSASIEKTGVPAIAIFLILISLIGIFIRKRKN